MTERSPKDQAERFVRQAAGRPSGLLRERTDFLRHNRKWWLVPIIILLLVSALVFLTNNPVTAPMIYTMF